VDSLAEPAPEPSRVHDAVPPRSCAEFPSAEATELRVHAVQSGLCHRIGPPNRVHARTKHNAECVESGRTTQAIALRSISELTSLELVNGLYDPGVKGQDTGSDTGVRCCRSTLTPIEKLADPPSDLIAVDA
jgi:hypothetical protein